MKVSKKQRDEFTRKFDFRKDGAMLVGVERECFLTNLSGKIVPRAFEILEILGINSSFHYELSACQLEDRAGPAEIGQIKKLLALNEEKIATAEKMLGLKRNFGEVAPEDIPLDIYPDPTGRYQKITKDMPTRVLRSACRVIGTHIHIGMPNHNTAIKVYNGVIKHTQMLCGRGDGSNGKRMEMYKIMAPDFAPPRYENWDDFCREAADKGFADDPRKCWHLIRMSVHGTIEFRMFGATPDIDKVIEWAEICHGLCLKVLGN